MPQNKKIRQRSNDKGRQSGQGDKSRRDDDRDENRNPSKEQRPRLSTDDRLESDADWD